MARIPRHDVKKSGLTQPFRSCSKRSPRFARDDNFASLLQGHMDAVIKAGAGENLRAYELAPLTAVGKVTEMEMFAVDNG